MYPGHNTTFVLWQANAYPFGFTTTPGVVGGASHDLAITATDKIGVTPGIVIFHISDGIT